MDPVSLLLLGLELRRFAPADDAAASLGDSLEVIEAGGLSLSPYDGPAVQPVLGWRSRRLTLSLAPGLAGSRSTATSSDGREATVRTLLWRGEARAWVHAGPALFGLDAGLSGGGARTGGASVATAPTQLELAPTGGVRAALAPTLDLVARARYPVRLAGDQLEHGLSGALLVEWHPGSRREEGAD